MRVGPGPVNKEVMIIKKALPIIIALAALAVLAIKFTSPFVGDVTEAWETTNGSFRLRVENRSEQFAFLPGTYFVFQSAPADSGDWKEIMTFRDDDIGTIRRDQVRFVDEQVGYVFMGWKYAVTTDGGATWSVWDAEKVWPEWCCNYGLIGDVQLSRDGIGMMRLHLNDDRRGEGPTIHTKDYGKHWTRDLK